MRSWFTGLAVALLLSSATLARAEESAEQLMKAAHDGRAVWHEFPGFHSDITAKRDDQVHRGTLAVSRTGTIVLSWRGAREPPAWVERSLSSIINHRLGEGIAITGVEFADENKQHPLGRLIRSTTPAEKSLWRVQGDVLTEVHRISDKTRMIISIGEVARTANGKHLPRSFTTTTFDAASGAIESTRQVVQEWKEIGRLSLPARIIAMISNNKGERHVEEITLANHWLRAKPANVSATITALPELPAPVTSFGAAVSGDYVYAFGGHLGTVHKYSRDDQAHQLVKLHRAAPKAWEVVGEAPRRTGVALVAYKNHLYRIGGWEARNAKGAEQDLHSTADFARFDHGTNKWEDLSPLPEGRSSHDAALLGSKLYVVGGWIMNGDSDGAFHGTAYVADLDQPTPSWKSIAKPPFLRRAIALAGAKEKLYVIGGMDDDQETTTAVAIYDLAADAWSTGPTLPGKPIDGFAPSACALHDRIYATTAAGFVYRLSSDGQAWEEVAQLAHPRMSHRLVSDGERLFVLGGASRGSKVAQVEMLEVKDR
jgi:N-acetylneuraminic acid mutarotase